jgi:hypothetical protein
MTLTHSTPRMLAYISLHTDGEAVAVELLQIKGHAAAQRVEERQALADQPVLARNLRGRKQTCSLSCIFGDSGYFTIKHNVQGNRATSLFLTPTPRSA